METHIPKEPWWIPLLFTVVPVLLGSIAAQIGLSIPHAATIWQYPNIWPPLWLFWAVWIVIYPCWGYATYLVWRKRQVADVCGALAFFTATIGSNFFFMPVAALSGQNPRVMTRGDLNGIFTSLIVAWLYSHYERKTMWFLLPLLVWMPITFGLKLLYWSVNL